jgi:hypothetical protein
VFAVVLAQVKNAGIVQLEDALALGGARSNRLSARRGKHRGNRGWFRLKYGRTSSHRHGLWLGADRQLRSEQRQVAGLQFDPTDNGSEAGRCDLKFPVGFVRDMEAGKIWNPETYSIYCLANGLHNAYPAFEKGVDVLSRTELDKNDRPLRRKKKQSAPPQSHPPLLLEPDSAEEEKSWAL